MGSPGQIMYYPESSDLSGDVVKGLFDMCSGFDFLFRDLALRLLDALVKTYHDEQQDTSK